MNKTAMAGDGGVSDPLSPATYVAGWYAIFATMAIVLAFGVWKKRELTFMALCAITGMSLFWQEFYQDWGSYLLYSPKFDLLPWGSTLWTTPNKPAFMPFSYFVFYGIAFPSMVAASAAVHRQFPTLSKTFIIAVIASIVMYLINIGQEFKSVQSGYWSYVDTVGPAYQTIRRRHPWVWPSIAIMFMGFAVTLIISRRDEHGHPLFERYFYPERCAAGLPREIVRALAWIFVINVVMMITLTIPTIAFRIVFGAPSELVP